ncbi:MAG: AI-2E family transporter [Candidatus Nanoperiomorbaceae bacterium]
MDNNSHKLSISTDTFIRFWLVILGFLAALGVIWLTRGAMIMIAVSFFLALVLNRPVSFFARHLPGKSRVLATLVAYLLIVAIIVLLFFNVIPIFIHQISTFIGNAPDLIKTVQSRNNGLEIFLAQHNLAAQYNAWLANLTHQLGSFADQIGNGAVGTLTALVNGFINVIMVAVLTFLMLIEGPDWEVKFWSIVYRDPTKRKRHQAIAKKMYDVVSGYITGQAIVAAISATLTALAIWILSMLFHGIDSSLVLPAWITIFVMTFIPMFGAAIGGMIVTLLLALFSWPAAIIYLAFFIIEQQFENNFMSPKIQSKRLNISALIVLSSILIGLNLAGILGALVAIPVAGCIMVLIREILRERQGHLVRADHGNEPTDNYDVSVVFVAQDRKFVKPKFPHHKSSRTSPDTRKD